MLLDLELPTRSADAAHPDRQEPPARSAAHPAAHTGFIVITAFGHDSPDLASGVIKLGANDFVKKPFPGLERSLRRCRRRFPSMDRRGNEPKPTP